MLRRDFIEKVQDVLVFFPIHRFSAMKGIRIGKTIFQQTRNDTNVALSRQDTDSKQELQVLSTIMAGRAT
jgi:hypothetical protein